MTTKLILAKPVDFWSFKGGYDMAMANSAASCLFPPPGKTVLGMLRTLLAAPFYQNDEAAFWSNYRYFDKNHEHAPTLNNDEIANAIEQVYDLAGGTYKAGAVSIRRIFPYANRKVLFPLPAHFSYAPKGATYRLGRSKLSASPIKSDISDESLFYQALAQDEAQLAKANNFWITAEVLTELYKKKPGNLVTPKQGVYHIESLISTKIKTGNKLTEQQDTGLFQQSIMRLNQQKGVALGISIGGAAEAQWATMQAQTELPLGGESQLAALAYKNLEQTALADVDSAHIELISTSPVVLTDQLNEICQADLTQSFCLSSFCSDLPKVNCQLETFSSYQTEASAGYSLTDGHVSQNKTIMPAGAVWRLKLATPITFCQYAAQQGKIKLQQDAIDHQQGHGCFIIMDVQ